ncbi:hypothetical protein [Streptomyces sp. HPF1205]|uniref:hypothetical protein n=1 Tax=Streptomyces sp. HPF1205 TaxID=2873262 RepID=UPI001CED88BE|nr:hypothetical protein [Streptomyces sp. HPF1205]
MRRTVALLFTAFLAIVGGLVLAPAASASGYGCSGSEIGSYPVTTSGGTNYGTIHIYYDSSTGNNCAVAVGSSAVSGKSDIYMSVTVFKCAETSISPTCTYVSSDIDHDYYYYYAGPVTMYAPSNCIQVGATIRNDNINVVGVGSSGGAKYC